MSPLPATSVRSSPSEASRGRPMRNRYGLWRARPRVKVKEMKPLLALFVCAISVLAVEPGQRAPGFALPDSKLNVVDLYDFRGKPVLLEFMKTDCPHCAAFATTLERLQAKFGDKVSIIAVANPPDTIGTVASYIKGHNIKYPMLFDMGQAAFSYLRKQE